MQDFNFNLEESLIEVLDFMSTEDLQQYHKIVCENYRSACVDFTVKTLASKVTVSAEQLVLRLKHLTNALETAMLKRGQLFNEDLF